MIGEGKDMRKKERRGGTRIRIDGKIPRDEESWRGDHVMRAPERKEFPMHLNIWSPTSNHTTRTRYKYHGELDNHIMW